MAIADPHRNLLSQADVDKAFAPIERARTLPPSAFTDPQFFCAEQEHIFWGGWAAICLTDLVSGVGDAVPLSFAGAPILVVRSGPEEIRVFHNICPYDQCPVLLEPSYGMEVLVGAYHGWRYDLHGNLIATPYREGQPADCPSASLEREGQLKEIPSARWGMILFANVSGATSHPFEAYIAPIQHRFADIDLDALHVGRNDQQKPDIARFSWAGNWKTHHENACINIYHENTVHATYRASEHVPRVNTKGQKRFETVCEDGLRGLAFSKADAGDTYLDMGVPDLTTRSGTPVTYSVIVSLYPNLYVSLIGAHVHVTIVTPTSENAVEASSASYFERDVAESPLHALLRALVAQAWTNAGDEDAAIICAIHDARRSPAATSGFYAPFWDHSHWDFTRQVLSDLGFAPSDASCRA